MIKFGPSGLGGVKEAEEHLEEYSKAGLKACEIAFTYGVYIKEREDAVRIGKKAEELGVKLSIHAPYWINLNSKEKNKIKQSKERILKSCEVGHYLKAEEIVFHPGYYGMNDKETAFDKIKEGILDLKKEIKKRGWKVKLAPETMGRVNVFGSVEEISRLVKSTGCSFCVDFAHVLAREKKMDFDMLKKKFPYKKWHCHFSGIVYGEKGEKRHKDTEKKEWINLLKELKNYKSKEIVIISESPSPFKDSVEGKKIFSSL